MTHENPRTPKQQIEQRLQFFSALPVGILWVMYEDETQDWENATVHDLNGAAAAAFNSSEADLLGRPISKLIPIQFTSKRLNEISKHQMGYHNHRAVLPGGWYQIHPFSTDDTGLYLLLVNVSAEIKLKEFERIVVNLTSALTDLSDMDNALHYTLEVAALFTESDRAYLFVREDEEGHFSNTHEWCKAGVSAEKQNLQMIHIAQELPWFYDHMKRGLTFNVGTIENFPPEALIERRHFEMQGILSLLVVPIFIDGELLGFMGFDAVRTQRTWPPEYIDLLRVLANSVGRALSGSDLLNRLRTEVDSLRDMVRKKEELGEHRARLIKEESLKCIAGAVSHNYNNLLSIIMGNLEIALDADVPDKGTLRNALSGAEKAARMGVQLLGYLGCAQNHKRNIEVTSKIKAITHALKSELQHCKLSWHLSTDPLFIIADPDQMKIALTNIILNALEAMENLPQELHLFTTSMTKAEISNLRFEPAGFEPVAEKYAVISILDKGEGIPEEIQGSLCDPFFTTRFLGRGMGLAECRGIMKNHDGALSIDSIPHKGTRVSLYFPQNLTSRES